MDQSHPDRQPETHSAIPENQLLIFLPSVDVMGGLGVIVPVPIVADKPLSRDPRKDTDGYVL